MSHRQKSCKQEGEFGWDVWEGQDRVLFGAKGNLPGIQIGDKKAEEMASKLEEFWRCTSCNVFLRDGRCLTIPQDVLEELANKYQPK